MSNDKVMKKVLKENASKNPDKYYPTSVLKENGFRRGKCKKCGTYFWTTDPEREVCDDPLCVGGYKFINNSPTKKKMDYIQVWKEFSSLFKKLGYTPIKRYPIAARWRNDTEFVQASIYDFQPYVVNGEIDPPANPLVVPQTCVRFNDLDNIGFSGRHYSLFTMIGQHAFVPPEKYDTEKYLSDIITWLTKGMGLSMNEITFHEDAWAGGGNAGPSMEFFSRGLEIGNQVYMQYDITQGDFKELKLKVLDMGMGQERPSWLTHGTSTSYEANFPTVIDKLYKVTGFKPDHDILEKFLPYSGLLNVDEVEDMEGMWGEIANKIGMEKEELKAVTIPSAALYSIADHTRSLLICLNDGILPSNTGGGYNLRVLARRALDLIRKNGWNLDLFEIASWHASYLKPQYPELSENLETVKELLDVEKKKYEAHKKKMKEVIVRLKGKEISKEELLKLYDSQGISPDMLLEEGIKVEVPSNFYALVSEMHEKTEAKAQTRKEKKLDLGDIAPTKILYYGNWNIGRFKGKIVKILDGKYVILDQTLFYPTSGGQIHDKGIIKAKGKDYKLKSVFKQNNIIVHELEDVSGLKEGMEIEGFVDIERRKQLTQHHTAAHILNFAARKVLGKHIWQAGAEKTLEKGRLDITHYELPSFEQIKEIERVANEIVMEGIKVEKTIERRDEAERKYGFVLYQGGAVPGKELRIVNIGNLDVEACGGTHLNNTLEEGLIKIINVVKIQDGVVRLEYVAGKKAVEYVQKMESLLKESSSILSVNYEQLPKTVEKFFNEWKELRKRNKELLDSIIKIELERIKNSPEKDSIHVVETTSQDLAMIANYFANENPSKGVVLFNKNEVVCSLGKELMAKKDATEILKKIGYKDVKGSRKFARGRVI